MNSLSVVVFCVAVAVASAAPGLLHAGVPVVTGSVLQGPGSRSTVAGPDGSVIDSADNGGAVVSDALGGAAVVGPSAAAAVHSAVGIHGYAAGPIAYGAAPIAYGAAPIAYGAVAAPAVENTLLAGPSGTVATSKHLLATPGLYHGAVVGAPAVYAANVW